MMKDNFVAKHLHKFNLPSVIPDKREKLAEKAELEYNVEDVRVTLNGEDVNVFDDIGCSTISID